MTTIINNQLNDYKRNHDGNEIEIDASEKGWLECARFYEKFIEDTNLKKKLTSCCYTNAIKTNNRRLNSIKIDKDGKEQEADFYDVQELSNIIINNPSYLEKFPMLKTFYKENGEINPSFITDHKLKDSTIAKKYTRYLALKYSDLLINELKKATKRRQIKTGLFNIFKIAIDEINKTEISTTDDNNNVVKLNDEDTKTNINIILDNCLKVLTSPIVLVQNKKTLQYAKRIEERRISRR